MGQRKISILNPAVTAVAEIAYFIECPGLPVTAKRFVDDTFAFFEKLSDDRQNINLVFTVTGTSAITAAQHSGRNM